MESLSSTLWNYLSYIGNLVEHRISGVCEPLSDVLPIRLDHGVGRMFEELVPHGSKTPSTIYQVCAFLVVE